MLSVVCCRQYAAIVFIENIRFDLSRKKLAYLTFADFVYCSNLMITHWSHNSSGVYTAPISRLHTGLTTHQVCTLLQSHDYTLVSQLVRCVHCSNLMITHWSHNSSGVYRAPISRLHTGLTTHQVCTAPISWLHTGLTTHQVCTRHQSHDYTLVSQLIRCVHCTNLTITHWSHNSSGVYTAPISWLHTGLTTHQVCTRHQSHDYTLVSQLIRCVLHWKYQSI